MKFALKATARGVRLSVTIIIAACVPDTRVTPDPTVRDSAGIRIVESAQPRWRGDASRWTLDEKAAIEIAGGAEDSAYYLHGVSAAHVLGNGSIVVGNSGTRQLLWFDSTGAFVRATGGPGEGPGEFGNVINVFRCAGDTLIVFEGRRLSMIAPDGSFLRTVPVAGHILRTSGTLGGVSNDCANVLTIEGEYRYPEPGERVHQLPHVLAWAAMEGATRDTLLVFPGPDLYPATIRGQAQSARLPFGKVPVWSTNGEVVTYGAADRFEIRAFDRGSGLTQIIRWAAEPKPVGGPAYEQFRAEQAAFVQQNPEMGRDITPADHFPVPQRMPAYAATLHDDAGNVWVRQYLHYGIYQEGPERQIWWIFEPAGAWQGTLETPIGLRVLSIAHGFVIGVARDADDVEFVKLYRLRTGVQDRAAN